ncbi:MAG: hypothetical protein LRS48_06440 [Desulfurococcales archaeon]|nr:hypothetical protein [Desulfurococcales archaeon]
MSGGTPVALKIFALALGSSISGAASNAANEIIAAIPKVVAILVILIAGYIVGDIIGKATSSAIRKLVEKPISNTVIGKKYSEYGFSLADFTGGIVKAYVFVISLIIALPYMTFTGPAFDVIKSIVYYLPKLLGGIVVLFYGILMTNLLADFIGTTVKQGLSEESKPIGDLLRNTVLVGMVAVIITIALNMMEINGNLVYTLILGFVVIALGAIITNTLFEHLEKYQSFSDYIGYGKFLFYVLFIMVGLSAIFEQYAGTIVVMERLAWGVAIAFAIMLIPLVYKLTKKMAQ